MQALYVIGFAAALGALWLSAKRYKSGESPFDRLPANVARQPSAQRIETVADGTRYRVYDWPVTGGKSFHVAEVKGANAWISFWLDPATGKRTMVASLAGASAPLNDLRKDWAV